MEFFDKLGKKMEEAYNTTKSKTEEMSKEFKIKNKISEKKSAIDKLYVEIGKIVYEDIKDSKDVSRDIVEEKCNEITTAREEIGKLEAEILKVKNIRICEGCKAEIPFDVEFCPKCGTKQPVNVEVKNSSPVDAEDVEAEVNDVDGENKE